eukprot:gene10636-7568_t
MTPLVLQSSARRVAMRTLCRRHSRGISSSCGLTLTFSPEVAEAKRTGRPIVALESTIISHGMPYPQNLAVARELESIVRRKGAVPATIAIIEGAPCIGLTDEQLQTLARDQKQVVKASTRDLAFVVAAKKHGATTVASTMRLAHLAGISVFATGGLGGVHRGAETTMDVSTDLIELGRTPVAVVCAGIKSILDVPKSLEVLETQGVPVVGFGTDVFPAFFTNDSGIKMHARADDAEAVARLLHAQRRLCPQVGAVLAVPNPQPADGAAVSAAIAAALAEADRRGVRGNAITPFLLERIEQLTGGASLAANIALVRHNVGVACDVALQLQRLERPPRGATDADGDLVERLAAALADAPGADSVHSSGVFHPAASNPGVVRESFGGVGRNVASLLARGGVSTALLSAWADDAAGARSRATAPRPAASTRRSRWWRARRRPHGGVQRRARRARRAARGRGGHGRAAPRVADYLRRHRRLVERCRVVVADANLSDAAFAAVADLAQLLRKPLCFEPTSDHKCVQPLRTRRTHTLTMLKPNAGELLCMTRYALEHCAEQFPAVPWANVRILLRSIEEEAASTQRHDVESFALLSGALMPLLYAAPQGGCAAEAPPADAPRHLFVSLGAQGLLWTARVEFFAALLGADAARDGATLRARDDVQVHVLQLTPSFASLHLQAPTLPPAERLCSNGAGDALFAAIVRATVARTGPEAPFAPSLDDVLCGLRAARRRLAGLDAAAA